MTHKHNTTERSHRTLGELQSAALSCEAAMIATARAYGKACQSQKRILTPDEVGVSDSAASGFLWSLYHETQSAWETGRKAVLLVLGLATLGAATLGSSAHAQTTIDEMLRQDGAALTRCEPSERIRVDGPLGANTLVEILWIDQASTAVVESGRCTCESWQPSWNNAVAKYEADFGGLDGAALQDATRELQKQAFTKSKEARTICREQGVR